MPASTLLVRQGYADVVRNMAGLVAYWRLSEQTGTVAREELNLANGTYTNTPTLGKAGLLVGDGDTSVLFGVTGAKYVSLPSVSLSSAQARTIAMWVLPSYKADALEVLFGWGSAAFYVLDGIVNNRNLRVFDGSVDRTANPAVSVTDKLIHFCVAVYSGTQWTFSLDGSLLGTPVTGAAPAATTSGTISRSTNPWNNIIGHTACWNRALSNNEIRTLYLAGTAR
jgi:hypothetical protein